ncbi:uncharacterized protein TRAVEDRAFT_131697, partial [Trametes versicolor FP-101664 SS1]|uniref:uncharacterized protein n=1 Tax=Trametes versicolor (strain FP-101664) TaxID=717944 RepID=UPI00046232EC
AYNGHKKYHALKFQAVMLPNGMFGHLFGPFEGRRNDNFLLHASKLLEKCARFAIWPGSSENSPLEQRYFQLFGDAAYGISPQLISPFAGARPRTEEEEQWNVAMGLVRVQVEHGFGLVTSTWQYLNANWKMHVYSSPVGRYYRVGVLLTNILNCYRPNQVSQYFDCEPPSITEYLHH